MSIQASLEAKGRFVPIVSSEVLINDAIDKLHVDMAGALVVTDDNQSIPGIITARGIARAWEERNHGG